LPWVTDYIQDGKRSRLGRPMGAQYATLERAV